MTAESAISAGVDGSERLSADDQATLREGQFLAAALGRQAHRAAATRSEPGVCANCRAVCLPQVVYCDDDCRTDHEQRQQTLRRQGRSR